MPAVTQSVTFQFYVTNKGAPAFSLGAELLSGSILSRFLAFKRWPSVFSVCTTSCLYHRWPNLVMKEEHKLPSKNLPTKSCQKWDFCQAKAKIQKIPSGPKQKPTLTTSSSCSSSQIRSRLELCSNRTSNQNPLLFLLLPWWTCCIMGMIPPGNSVISLVEQL